MHAIHVDRAPFNTPATFQVPFPAVHPAIPPVLDAVIATTWHLASDVSPLLAHFNHTSFDELAFVVTNGQMVERWLQVLMPSFPALLCGALADDFRDLYPTLRSVLTHKKIQPSVFVAVPGTSLSMLFVAHLGERVADWSDCNVGWYY